MGVDYAWEQFSSAIRLALVSDASPQERARNLVSQVSHLQRDSFPDERVWDDFRRLVNGTTSQPAGHEGDGRDSSNGTQMSDAKAKQRIELAFDIYSRVARAFGRSEFVI